MDFKRYPLNAALAALGIDTKLKQFVFLLKHKRELNPNYINYGVTITQLQEILNNITNFECKLYGIKIKKEKRQ